VSLASLLKHLQLTVAPGARFLSVEGADVPEQVGAADFEHSVPLSDALDKSMLALELNGEALPRVHGGPVRFVVPGYYATMNVKWVRRLRFEAGESLNYHHVGRYRTPRKQLTPGGKFVSTLENSDANWNMKIKSVIFTPLDGEVIRPGATTIRGVAWNDGVARIAAVEVSVDGGETWRTAKVEKPATPYAWHHWQLTLPLSPGKHRVQSRASDVFGVAQPTDGSVHWNPAGYAWNGVDQVAVTVS
jgi:DMSO/TMAO reductase YedYZ molybdopterin-dependent catalytic subunit